MRKKNYLLLAILIIFGSLLSGCDLIGQAPEPTPMPTPVSDPGVVAEANLMPIDHITLRFSMPGRVAEILVEEGDFVQADEVLARLSNLGSLEAQVLSAERAVLEAEQRIEDLNESSELIAARARVNLAEAKQNLVEAERAWDIVDSNEFTEDLDDARLDMIDAEENLEDAEENLADHQDLDEDNPVRERYEDDVEEAQQAYDEAVWSYEDLKIQQDLTKAQLEAARFAVEDAQRRVDSTQEGPDPDDLALANAGLEQAQGQLLAAQVALEDAELIAPFEGKVVRIELTEGAFSSPETIAVVLADMSDWVLETNDLTEEEVVEIAEGDEVTVSFDSLPGLVFPGEVESISEYALERFGDITYVARIRLLASDERLRWGMTAEVNFSD